MDVQDGAGLTYQPPGEKVVQRAASDPSTETSRGEILEHLKGLQSMGMALPEHWEQQRELTSCDSCQSDHTWTHQQTQQVEKPSLQCRTQGAAAQQGMGVICRDHHPENSTICSTLSC